MKSVFLFSLALLLWPAITWAQLSTSEIFSDNMVLQRNATVPIWGWAKPKDRVTVRFNGQELKTKADKKTGKWMVNLSPMPVSAEPLELHIQARKSGELHYKNILIGDVWICSGQSNMEWIVQNTNYADEEIKNATDGQIRHIKIQKEVSTKPLENVQPTDWEVTSPQTVSKFTAVGYYFARELRKKVNVPIGLLNTTWGGTNVQTWTSKASIATVGDFNKLMAELEGLNVENYEEQLKQKVMEMVGETNASEPGMRDGVAYWAATDYDDSDWKQMELPTLWERTGLNGLDGVVWFRTTVNVPAEWSGKAATLHLGPVDDNEITWVNGKKVGETRGYNADRVYALPANTLRPGENIITVRVADTGGGGGIWGKPEQMYLEVDSEKRSLAGEWRFKVDVADINLTLKPNDFPTLLYNAMLHPLIPTAFTGVIWYQGESNAGSAYQYRTIFPLLIKDWRGKWGTDFPFLFVQLANFREPVETPSGSDWAELREAQTMTLSLPNTGMATIIDIGEADDIHPRNKQDVGHRLALEARRMVYGEDQLLSRSPMFEAMEIKGDKVVITFSNVGEGLSAKDRYGYVNGFTIAGSDQTFHWAKAEITGKNEVTVYSEAVDSPVAVRYAWADNPDDVNLYNSAGLPANPFRTDSWKGITEP